jgi:hypothetical protein
MTKEFVPCEQALALRELGFDEPCFTSYDDEGDLRNPFDYSNSEYDHNRSYIGDTKHFVYNSELTIDNFIGNKDLYKQFTAAPLYQQAFRWFRDNHGLHHEIKKEKGINDSTNIFFVPITQSGLKKKLTHTPQHTYEEAELACLKKLIEIVKS